MKNLSVGLVSYVKKVAKKRKGGWASDIYLSLGLDGNVHAQP